MLADVTGNFRYIAQMKGVKSAADICQKAIEASLLYSKSLVERKRSGFLQHLLDSSDKSVEAMQEHIAHMEKGDGKNVRPKYASHKQPSCYMCIYMAHACCLFQYQANSNGGFTTKPSPVVVSRMMPLRNNRVSSRAMEAVLSASNRENRQSCPPVNGGNSDPKARPFCFALLSNAGFF